jgi:CDP-glycerol glycerophosphotransferase
VKFKNLLARVSRRLNYVGQLNSPLSESVLFETFSGKQIGDSPLAIALELQKSHPELKLYWSTTSNATELPEGMTALRHGSAAWYRALATSKYLVNNANFPAYFRKREGQIYLQTWHGTPLKMIGQDIRNDRTSSTYQQTMKREADYWDYLISPSAYCTEIFPKAFDTKAKVLELGYPRNDTLKNVSTETRNEIRRKLGVTDPKRKLVLYAPTWRDNARGSKGGWESVNYLSHETQLPEGFTLLYRGHSNTHASHQAKNTADLIDVTFYPNIADLFIAADVLVTDYSSVMFDFSVTGKPMIFLTPDLKEYETDRGFYFDFRAQAPGLICSTAKEVNQALMDVEPNQAVFSKKYAAWKDKFNPQDDGQAAKRVVSAVWN